jgi:hypothetical protein
MLLGLISTGHDYRYSLSVLYYFMAGLTAGHVCRAGLTIYVYTDLESKTSIDKIRFYGYFVGADHEYDIKNCCLVLVSTIQKAAFMYSAF